MNCFTVNLPGTKATLNVNLRQSDYEFVEHHARPFVLVIPGGGYCFLSEGESEPIAMAFTTAGYQTAVLNYSVRPDDTLPYLGTTPLLEAAAAVRYIRDHATEWGVDPQKITVCGFSAGGHLTGSLGVFGANEDYIPGASDGKCLPNAMILGYPVITAGPAAHRDSFYHLTGHKEQGPENDRFSLELHVTDQTPPAFIWQPTTDDLVPVENSFLMAEALKAHNIPFDLHLFQSGWHGIKLANRETSCNDPLVSQWLEIALIWMNDTGVGPGYID